MNRKLAPFILATGVFASARQSYALHHPVAFSRGDGLMTVYAIGAQGISKKELTSYGWSIGWSTVVPWLVDDFSVAPSEGVGLTFDLIATRVGAAMRTNLLNKPPTSSDPWPIVGGAASAGPAVAPFGKKRIFFVGWDGIVKEVHYDLAYYSAWSLEVIPFTNAPTGFDEIAVGRVSATEYMVCGKKGDQFSCSPRIDPTQQYYTQAAWTTLPGSYSSRPAVSNWLGSLPEVFGHSTFDSQLWGTTTLFGWENPVPHGGDISGGPAAASMNSGGSYLLTYVFAKAGWDDSLWYTFQSSGGWWGWYQLN